MKAPQITIRCDTSIFFQSHVRVCLKYEFIAEELFSYPESVTLSLVTAKQKQSVPFLSG